MSGGGYRSIDRLLSVMAQLRDPDGGCPWDLEQTFATIVPHTIEEAYEVADAVERGAMDEFRGELGDLLLQVVFHAQMASEEGLFTFDTVVEGITEKLIVRHPHVFGDMSVADADAQTAVWETQKAEERAAKARAEGRQPSVLDDLTANLPAMTRAVKLGNRVARVGFDWPDVDAVLNKVDEEIGELQEERQLDGGGDPARVAEEMGDLLFVVAQLARKLKVDPETALRHANAKFERRFRHVETRLAEQGQAPQDVTLDDMEALWQEAKRIERGQQERPDGSSETA